jgi:hypothetical protein
MKFFADGPDFPVPNLAIRNYAAANKKDCSARSAILYLPGNSLETAPILVFERPRYCRIQAASRV